MILIQTWATFSVDFLTLSTSILNLADMLLNSFTKSHNDLTDSFVNISTPLKIIGRCKYCNKPIYEDEFYIKDVYGYIFDKEDCLIEQYKKEGLITFHKE